MKFIEPKVDKPPLRTVSRSDLKFIFSIVPEEWIPELKTVVLSAEQPNKSCFNRPVIYSGYSSRLNIISRGLDRLSVLREVLYELAICGGIASKSFGNTISASSVNTLNVAIEAQLTELSTYLSKNA
jgi:hypothetical protein